MKLSTQVRYGARAMLDLAVYYGKGPVLSRDIAERQEISLKYLDRILSSLKAAGLVKALRGAKGGYILNNPPAQVTVNQIMGALEGPLELVECVHNKNFCHRVNSCAMHDVWSELGKSMETMLKTTTLEDLVIKDKNKKKVSKMYYI